MSDQKLYIVHIAKNARFPERWVSKLVGKGKVLLTYKKEEAVQLDKDWAEKAATIAGGKIEPVQNESKSKK